MTQLDITTILNSDGVTLNLTKLEEAVYLYGVGSFLNSPYSGGPINNVSGFTVQQWVQFQIELQQNAIKFSNKSIPIIYGLDSVHGANYIYGAALFPHVPPLPLSLLPLLLFINNFILNIYLKKSLFIIKKFINR